MRRLALGLLLSSMFACRDGTAPLAIVDLEVLREALDGCPQEWYTSCEESLRSPDATESWLFEWTAQRLLMHWDPLCQDLGWELRSRMVAGRIRVWDGFNYGSWGDYHTEDPWEIHIWEPAGGGNSELGLTLTHELSHSRYGAWDVPFGPYQGSADWFENYCWSGMV